VDLQSGFYAGTGVDPVPAVNHGAPNKEQITMILDKWTYLTVAIMHTFVIYRLNRRLKDAEAEICRLADQTDIPSPSGHGPLPVTPYRPMPVDKAE
jgi:hypothetical protein